MPRKMTKQEALEIYGIDMDNVTKRDDAPIRKVDKPAGFDRPAPTYKSFDSIMLRKADEAAAAEDVRNEGDDDDKVSGKLKEMVAAMVVAEPRLSAQEHMNYLLHSPHGRKLAEHLNNLLSKGAPPMLDVRKLIPVLEEGLLARAKLTKRDGQSEAQAFAKLYESDIDFRKQWAIVTEAKMMMALSKSLPNMMSTTPTSTEVGNTGTADDSAEAVRLLSEMAEKQHRTFEQVFQDPDNAALAARTYTSHHRSSTSGSELQQR